MWKHMASTLYKSWSKIWYSGSQILGSFILFCQVWMSRRATRSNLTKPQTFPLEKTRGSNSGLRCSLVLYYIKTKQSPLEGRWKVMITSKPNLFYFTCKFWLIFQGMKYANANKVNHSDLIRGRRRVLICRQILPHPHKISWELFRYSTKSIILFKI